MVDVLAIGLPAFAVALAVSGMLAVRHSAKVLKEKLNAERNALSLHGTVTPHEAATQGYGEVHMSIRLPETVEAQ